MTSWVLVSFRLALVAGLVLLVGGRGWDVVEETSGVLRTSPSCDEIIGYSGPNDCEIRLDRQGRIDAVRLLRSGDTQEHVAAVREDRGFLVQFRGLSAMDPAAFSELDGVSRATLTSLAVVEAVARRLSGARPSLRFPLPASLSEVRRFLPAAAQLRPWPGAGRTRVASMEVFDRHRARIGLALRTGPLAEAVLGYQGPTDTLLVFAGRQLRGLVLRRSYDNEPYVGYVRDDRYFAEQLLGKTVAQLSALREDSIDAVSGATMTSQAVVSAVVRAAGLQDRALRRPLPDLLEGVAPALRGRDIGTLLAVLLALVLTFSRLRGRRWLRLLARVSTVLYLGILSGDMLSQGLLVGWVDHGVPFHLAPGLVALAGVALLIPVTTGRQVYCHQLCAHGALQELLRRLPWRRPLPPPLARLRAWLSGGLLVASVLGLALLAPGFPHAALEPFGAWAWPLAGVATGLLALFSLILASIYPMSYCRLACPTGHLLDFLRRRERDRLGRRDGVAVLLLVVAGLLRYQLLG